MIFADPARFPAYEPGDRRSPRVWSRRRVEPGGSDRRSPDAYRPRWAGGAFAFVACWALSLATVATLALLLADGADPRQGDGPATWVSVVQIVIGVLLVLVAVLQWRGRGKSDPELPSWMQKVDGLTTPRAAATAVFLAAAKPKNLLLTIGASVAVAELGVSAKAQASALAVFVFLGTLAPGIPLALSLAMGARGTALLAKVRSWMVRENTLIVAVLCLVFAAKLLGDALVHLGS